MTTVLPGSGQAYSNVVRATSAAQQAFVAATRAPVTGTNVRIPAAGLKVGDRYKARFNLAKTGAGTATSTVDVATVARDAVLSAANATARISFTKPAGTGVADEGVIEINVAVRSVSATGTLVGSFTLIHNLAATGHAQVPVVALYAASSAFDNSDLSAGLLVVCMTTGASDVITTELAQAEYVQRTV